MKKDFWIRLKEYLNAFVTTSIRIIKNLIYFFGIAFFIMIFLAFTRVPFDLHRWLGNHSSEINFIPDYIIMLGGGGMPSGENLSRLYYASATAKKFENAKIIIAHPIDSGVSHSMSEYLFQNGIDRSRIQLMMKGTNTRQQAQHIATHLKEPQKIKVAIITSPENMFRSVKTFRKLKFENCGGVAAYDDAMFVDLNYDFKNAGGKILVPDVSENLDLRYNFWNYLKLEITCLREFIAIGYYKVNGWI